MRELNLTDAQFEHTLGILSEVDVSPLVAAFGDKGSLADLLGIFPMLGQVRDKKILRRLEAIWMSSPEELEAAEALPESMDVLVKRAAGKQVKETMEGVQSFFSGLGLSLFSSPGSLGEQTKETFTRNEILDLPITLLPADSPSASSLPRTPEDGTPPGDSQ